MKPKLVVKTTKGHQYLQLLDLYGNLIHIGSADKAENWCVAFHALKDNYEGFAVQESMELDAGRFVEYVNRFRMEAASAPWRKYCEKRMQARVNHEFFVKMIDKVPEEQIYQELVDYRTKLERMTDSSNTLDLSSDVFELIEPIIQEAKRKVPDIVDDDVVRGGASA